MIYFKESNVSRIVFLSYTKRRVFWMGRKYTQTRTFPINQYVPKVFGHKPKYGYFGYSAYYVDYTMSMYELI